MYSRDHIHGAVPCALFKPYCELAASASRVVHCFLCPAISLHVHMHWEIKDFSKHSSRKEDLAFCWELSLCMLHDRTPLVACSLCAYCMRCCKWKWGLKGSICLGVTRPFLVTFKPQTCKYSRWWDLMTVQNCACNIFGLEYLDEVLPFPDSESAVTMSLHITKMKKKNCQDTIPFLNVHIFMSSCFRDQMLCISVTVT